MVRTAFDVSFDNAYDRAREIIADCLQAPDVAAAKQTWESRRAAAAGR
jgi:hypothetical protein